MRLASVSVIALLAATLVAATLALAKEGGRARLSTPLQLEAAPGKRIHVNWTVSVSGENGRRVPFSAGGMFVRLLSRTGGPSTTVTGREPSRPAGRYAADAVVPAGGIGGVRFGLHGMNDFGPADLLFPVENDPFTSSRGVRCDVATLGDTLQAFVRAYNRGDLRRLDALFSRTHFAWYSSDAPGTRLRAEAANRNTLVGYFDLRHRRGERLSSLRFRFNRYDAARDLGHFEVTAHRRADDFRDGRWFRVVGKGALDCSKGRVTIAVMSLGSAA